MFMYPNHPLRCQTRMGCMSNGWNTKIPMPTVCETVLSSGIPLGVHYNVETLFLHPGESATWYEWIVTPLLLLCYQVLKARLPLPAAPCYIYFGRLLPFNYLTR
ncbi:hypothetical protein T12_4509 [Trichinella patagoniensis]|uniref:Uncharacterized protein n=1 Tax=Trichinella patagoniensis TaxID=990121 RepID=A0A0V0Z8Y1_9BILA|nr:hypothetical protein T12_4509 [Trichinella patagoniensis]